MNNNLTDEHIKDLQIPITDIKDKRLKGFTLDPELEYIIDYIYLMKKRKGLKSDIVNEALRRYFKDLGILKEPKPNYFE